MSDAPERIWACASKNTKSGVVTLLGDATFPVDGWQEYVRADAIAALAEQLAAARRDAEEAEAYAGELEQQLGKAVDALRAFNSFDDLPTEVKRPDIFEINVRLPILRALAELTGGKDE